MEEELTYSQFPFLKELGIEEENHGCYDGKKWSGSGDIISALNPTTGKVNKLEI
jgi:aldehyde dehydrogenase family 7 protein A1